MSLDQPLTADQVAKFFRQGFLVVEAPRVIVGQELERCHKILMRLIEQGVGRKEGRNFDLAARSGGEGFPSPQMVRPSLYAAELARLSCRSTALALAKQLLGPDASFALERWAVWCRLHPPALRDRDSALAAALAAFEHAHQNVAAPVEFGLMHQLRRYNEKSLPKKLGNLISGKRLV
jgi:hypothetical protein